jgi:hypothetical protein
MLIPLHWLPACEVTYKIEVDVGLSTQKTLNTIVQHLANGQFLSFPLHASFTNLRISVIKSESWVAWNKVVFYTGEHDCKCISV